MNSLGKSETLEHIHNFTGFIVADLESLSEALGETLRSTREKQS
jgi:hypothetical protein